MNLAHSHHKVIRYVQNVETGYFEKQPSTLTFQRLPFELKIEETQDEKIKRNGALYILRGRVSGGKYTFFTGMLPVRHPRWDGFYIGNDYQYRAKKKINSLIVVRLAAPDAGQMDVHYFQGFYIENREERIKAVINYIDSIVREPIRVF